MRNMSFALTTKQIMEGTKSVTRRVGWTNLRPGDMIQPVRKCMGLRPGEKLDVLRDPLTVVSVRREPLRAMLDDLDYGFAECEREGFGSHPDYRWPSAFVDMFCATHAGCTPETLVTRIEFAYQQEANDQSHCERIGGTAMNVREGFSEAGRRAEANSPSESNETPGYANNALEKAQDKSDLLV